MKETNKTITFACVGIGMVLLAGLQYWWSQPRIMTDFEEVGKPFFEDFTDAQQAKSLEVYALDPDSTQLQQFRVEYSDGLWRIPSHYDYPAEAADRLASTAASVMGLTRESLAGRLPADHERMGVVDPLGDQARDPLSVGKRLTLKDADGVELVDYIIGKEAGEVAVADTDRMFGDQPSEKYYYLRRPDEQQTYKVRLDVDLSTRFADWIQPDLLQLADAAIQHIEIDNYQLREQAADPLGQVKRLVKTQGDQLLLTRDGGFGPWTLQGMDPEKEELDNARANQIANTLDELKIVGVRPKFKYNDQPLLTPDLRLNNIPELVQDPAAFNRAVMRLQMELDNKGFNLAPVKPNSQELMLVSERGQLSAGLDNGVLYTLHVGKPIAGDEKTIEIGGSDTAEQPNEQAAEPAAEESRTDTNGAGNDVSDTETTSDDETDEDQSSEDPNETDQNSEDAKNRFVMIRVAFDENLLGDRPEEPVKPLEPVEPEGYQRPSPDEAGDQTTDAAQQSSESADNDANQGTSENPNDQPNHDSGDDDSGDDSSGDAGENGGPNASQTSENENANGSRDGNASPTDPANGSAGFDDPPAAEQDPDQKPDETDSVADPAAQQDQQRKPEFVEYDQKLKEYQQAETQYQLDLTRFEDQQQQFEERITQGKTRVDELNERFGTWYYVISADNLKSLQVTRAELVTKKTPSPTELPPKPDITFPPDDPQ